jgi:hypothetical protein
MIGERYDVDVRMLWHASHETSLNILMRSKRRMTHVELYDLGRNGSISDCVECMMKSVPPGTAMPNWPSGRRY